MESKLEKDELESVISSQKFKRFFLLVFIPIVIVLITIGYFYSLGRYITTENAYIKAPIISIQSQVPGRIEKVYIKNNQKVQKGQKLFKIDTEKLELDLIEEKENLLTIEEEIKNRKSKYNEAKDEIKLAKEQIRFYFNETKRVNALLKVETKLAQEKIEYQSLELKRIRNLFNKGVGLKSKLDEAEYLFKSSINNLNFVKLNNDYQEIKHLYTTSKQKLSLSEDKARTILTTLHGNEKINPEEHPLYLKYFSKFNKIKFDIRKATVIAKQDGVIAKMNIEEGEYINTGKILFAIVDEEKAWLEVNLKETDLTNIEVDQSVIFTPDSYPNISWNGKVESLSPATGAEFSILPPQNSSGNWVKVVQRVPVRVAIGEAIQKENQIIGPKKNLRVGMSVSVTIDTEFERQIPYIIRPFANLIKLF